MTDIFISYQRKQQAFVEQLAKEFKNAGKEVWVDLLDIPKASNWLDEIYHGIEGADAFVAVLTHQYLVSEICVKEVTHALKHKKKIIPVVRELDPNKVPESFEKLEWKAAAIQNWQILKSLNWIYFNNDDLFSTAFQDLLTAAETDLAFERLRTRLTVRSGEWINKNKSRSLLLRGTDLKEAEKWLAVAQKQKRGPSPGQVNYIAASRKAETIRNRIIVGGLTSGLMIFMLLSIISIWQSQLAESNDVKRKEQEIGRINAQNTAMAESSAKATQQSIAQVQEKNSNAKSLAAKAQTELNKGFINEALSTSFDALNNYVYTVEAEQALAQAVLASRRNRVIQMSQPPIGIVWAPNNRYLADIDASGTLSIIDLGTGTSVFTRIVKDLRKLQWSEDSQIIILSTGKEEFGLGDTTMMLKEAYVQTAWIVPSGEAINAADIVHIKVSPFNVWRAQEYIANETLEAFPGRYGVTGDLYAEANSPTVNALAQSYDKTRLVLCTRFGHVYVDDTRMGQQLFHLDPVDGATCFQAASWSPDNTRFALVYGTSIHLFDVEEKSEIFKLPLDTVNFSSVAWTSDGNYLAAADQAGVVRIWQIVPGDQLGIALRQAVSNATIFQAKWSPVEKNLLVNSSDGIGIFNTEKLQYDPLPLSNILNVVWSPDGSKLLALAINEDGQTEAKIWDMRKHQVVNSFPIFDPVMDLLSSNSFLFRWSQDNQAIAGGFQKKVWKVETGQATNYPTFSDIAWSSDGHYVALVQKGENQEDEIRIIDTASNHVQLILPTSTHPGGPIAWSMDSQFIATASENNTATIWDAHTGKSLRVLNGHTNPITFLAWSPSGRHLVTLSGSVNVGATGIFSVGDNTARIWDVSSGFEMLKLPLSGIPVEATWSVDGRWLTTIAIKRDNDSSLDATLFKTDVWRLWSSPDDLTQYATECCIDKVKFGGK